MTDYVSKCWKRWMRSDYKLNNVLSYTKLESWRPSTKRSRRESFR